ncbi:hypothetical protein V5279_18945 [Bradyrhizobium sp. 26S5]|uniref:hypothetical protein n=1 Tax=Bradyrhizobium sp. 26S5 TaxID=3139729 RepID=UPI0030CEF94B
MTAYQRLLRLHALIACLLCLSTSVALPQPSGTLFQRTATASGAGTLTVEFDVVGPVEAGTQTELTLEIGPEGNNGPANPVPAPSLPDTAAFTVSTDRSAGSQLTFPPAGGTNQNFAGKAVSLIRLDPSDSPALYRLIVVHPIGVPGGTPEKWKVVISGLPQVKTRAMGAIKQGVFSGQMPVGACQTLPGQSGTALQQLVTFRGAASPAIGIDIAGPRDPLTQTTLLLEFGPEGNAQLNPVPDPALPDTARMRIGTGAASVSFPFANSDENFANKELHLVRFAPGLYLLVIRHLAGIPDRTTEHWKVELTGIPTTLRAIGSVEQGTIASLAPVLPCQDPPRISVSPSLITGGETRDIVVSTGSEDFDLSGVSDGQLRFDPPNIVTRAAITNRSPRSLTVSVTTAELAQTQSVSLVVTANNVTSQPTTFDVVPRPGISVTPSFVIADGQATLNITTSSNVFDLSNGRVEISPPNIATGITVTSATPSALSATVTLAAVDQPQNLSLTVVANNVRSRPATFVVRPRPRINLSPTAGVGAGRTRLTVSTTASDFDLSNVQPGQIELSPGIATIASVSGQGPRTLNLELDLTDVTARQDLAIRVTAGGVRSEPATFVITPRPHISLSAPSGIGPGRVRLTVSTTASDFDLSNVQAGQIGLSPGIATVVSVSGQSARTLNLDLDLASVTTRQNLEIRVTANNVTSHPAVFVVVPRPTISVSPTFVLDQTTAATVTVSSASTDFDLSRATVDISPSGVASNIVISGQSQRQLTVTFAVSSVAATQAMRLIATANNIASQSAAFEIRQRPGISISPDKMDQHTNVQMSIRSRGGLDLSNLTLNDITLSGQGLVNAQLLPLNSGVRDARTFEFASDQNTTTGPWTIVVRVGGSSFSNGFSIRPMINTCPNPQQICCKPGPTSCECRFNTCLQQVCDPGLHCCRMSPSGTSCLDCRRVCPPPPP